MINMVIIVHYLRYPPPVTSPWGGSELAHVLVAEAVMLIWGVLDVWGIICAKKQKI